jgi:hypothetical protein
VSARINVEASFERLRGLRVEPRSRETKSSRPVPGRDVDRLRTARGWPSEPAPREEHGCLVSILRARTSRFDAGAHPRSPQSPRRFGPFARRFDARPPRGWSSARASSRVESPERFRIRAPVPRGRAPYWESVTRRSGRTTRIVRRPTSALVEAVPSSAGSGSPCRSAKSLRAWSAKSLGEGARGITGYFSGKRRLTGQIHFCAQLEIV